MFLVLDPRVRVPDMGHKSLALQRTVPFFHNPSLLWVTMPGVGLLARPCLYLFHSSQRGPFIFCCGDAVYLVFTFFFFLAEIIPCVAVNFCVCGRRGVQDLSMPPFWTTFSNGPHTSSVCPWEMKKGPDTATVRARYLDYSFKSKTVVPDYYLEKVSSSK